jgi:hypothetical protein
MYNWVHRQTGGQSHRVRVCLGLLCSAFFNSSPKLTRQTYSTPNTPLQEKGGVRANSTIFWELLMRYSRNQRLLRPHGVGGNYPPLPPITQKRFVFFSPPTHRYLLYSARHPSSSGTAAGAARSHPVETPRDFHASPSPSSSTAATVEPLRELRPPSPSRVAATEASWTSTPLRCRVAVTPLPGCTPLSAARATVPPLLVHASGCRPADRRPSCRAAARDRRRQVQRM